MNYYIMDFVIELDTPKERQEQRIKVAPSRLLDSMNLEGLGLYAFSNEDIVFRPGDLIAPYKGEILTTEERKRRYGKKWGAYLYYKPWGHPSIDAQYLRSASAYANDGVHLQPTPLDNSYLAKGNLYASKEIKNGEEILLDYGKGYWNKLCKLSPYTPVVRRGSYMFKRDDLFYFGGVRGGKVRSCLALIKEYQRETGHLPEGLITAGSRCSPQVEIVSCIAKSLRIPATLLIPKGKLNESIKKAVEGNELIRINPGFNHYLSYCSRQLANERQKWLLIPFGMESPLAVNETAKQTNNLPINDIKRLVVPVGSGLTLAGIIKGLYKGELPFPIIGIVVGKRPEILLDTYVPQWRKLPITLINSPLEYHKKPDRTEIEDIDLDPIYEAKIIPYLESGDCAWLVGHRL